LFFIELLALKVLRTLEQVSPRLFHAHDSWNLQPVVIKTKEKADHFQNMRLNVTKSGMLKELQNRLVLSDYFNYGQNLPSHNFQSC
jgi:hypothetical protein